MAGHGLDRQEVPGDNVIARNAHFTEVAHPLYGRYQKQNQQFTLDSSATHVYLNPLVLRALSW